LSFYNIFLRNYISTLELVLKIVNSFF